MLITELCYSSDSCWLGKARDLVISILKENSNLLHPEILTKLALSFARAQMTVPASMILRVMLEREHMPPMNIFSLVVFHMVQTEIGACLASNILVQICYCFLSLSAKRNSHAKGMKPDTMFFNIILDACVRYRFALKGQQIVELMSQIGVIADAHTIAILAHIHEMNGQRDEIKKFKDHIDRVSASFVCHYQQYYDSLLNLHFMFDDIDAAAELVLDMLRPREFITSKAVGDYTKLSYFVPIGSCNLKVGSKLQIEPELLQKDSILNVEHKEDLIAFRNGKLLLNNRALAKLIIGFKNHGRIADLSNLLHSIQKDFHALEGSNLCSDVIDACIHVGWLQTAHDILDDMEAFGDHMNLTVYMVLLTAYYSRRMFKEAKALQRQMRKAGLILASSDEMIASTCLAVSRDAASSALSKSDLAEFLVLEMKEEKVISPIVYALNSSVYFFCKAKMIKDALKSYHRIQGLPVLPTSQTFAYLIFGYTSLERYRDITILWGDIKRYMKGRNLVVSRDLYELFLLNFIRGGYFERVMEVIAYMEERNMFTDKLMYKSEFLRHHKNLYTGLKASDARTEAQKLRLEYVKKFRKWVSVASI
uniref:Pentatricopeptide repeat-containing protein n=1 Tax=Rhizophora mucronata TaxID=61149 RepID=A0A2P2IPU2_RHIMU